MGGMGTNRGKVPARRPLVPADVVAHCRSQPPEYSLFPCDQCPWQFPPAWAPDGKLCDGRPSQKDKERE